jgi:hypothetical protein
MEVGIILSKFVQCMSLFMARSVGSLPRSDTSEVGGEADMPRRPTDAVDPFETSRPPAIACSELTPNHFRCPYSTGYDAFS